MILAIMTTAERRKNGQAALLERTVLITSEKETPRKVSHTHTPLNSISSNKTESLFIVRINQVW
jgi:hypothetical protein